MHSSVAIAVKNNGWHRWLVPWNYPVIGPATLSHGDKCGGEVNGGPAGEAGMYTGCRVQIRVSWSHDSCRFTRQSPYLDAVWVERIGAHDFVWDGRHELCVNFV